MTPKAFASLRITKCSTKSNPRALRVEAIFISLNTNRLLRHKKHSLPVVCLPSACRLPAGKGRAKAGQRQGKGRLAMTYSYILTLGMLADNHKIKIMLKRLMPMVLFSTF